VPLDLSFAGRTYPPTEPYRVGREKIREFADAIGADDPAYRDVTTARAQGHPDVVAPPTFPVMLTMAAGQVAVQDPALGLDYSRVVHGDQRFAYTRPVYAGDELTCTCTVEDVMSRAGNDFVTVRTDVRDAAGELVVTVWSRLVARAAGGGA
jgi:acyl dehydratase